MSISILGAARPQRAFQRRSRRHVGALAATLCVAISALALSSAPQAVQAQTVTLDNTPILEARDAFRKRDRLRMSSARAAANASGHPLAMWTDYWDLNQRINELQQPEVNAFYARWPGTYVEDRFRNDWLLELGKRRDWLNFAADRPLFRMNDDRQVNCYSLLIEHQAGNDVRDAALAAWFAQRDSDDACALMAATLVEAKVFTSVDIWRKARHALEAGRPTAARQAVVLLGPDAATQMQALLDSPTKFLLRRAAPVGRDAAELSTLALMRLASGDPEAAARLLGERWERELPPDLASWVWAVTAKQTAMKLLPNAVEQFDRAAALALQPRASGRPAQTAIAAAAAVSAAAIEWPDETLAWKARAALRGNDGRGDWPQVLRAIDAMTPQEQADPTWVYWKARGLRATAAATAAAQPARADALTAQADGLLGSIAGQFHFYGKLAAEDLGRSVPMPPAPRPLTAEERADTVRNPGLDRSLMLIELGLRSEGVREWNYTLRGMTDRELLAAAQWACDREVWDRCINTSDRTRNEVDLAQRFPTPHRRQVVLRSQEIGLDPAYVYGLIRQESRFIMDARSHVGASGLMQLMPATARWTARKIGLPYTPEAITDRDTNIKLGTSYLKLVLDDLNGSQAMGAAAYNAGPGRPRRWREGPVMDAAAWAENIPFSETRDYVKKVLSNATYYAALLSPDPRELQSLPSLRQRLGSSIGPREDRLPPPDRELP